MKAGASASGNQCLLSRVTSADGLRSEENVDGRKDRMTCMGLYPRKAENSAEVAGILLKTGISIGAPAA